MFPDPHRFDIERPNAGRHLAFSGGRHFCLGAALARAEGEVGLRTFFERFPDVRAAGTGSRRNTRVLRGWSTLPVALGSGAVDGSGRRLSGLEPARRVSGDAAVVAAGPESAAGTARDERGGGCGHPTSAESPHDLAPGQQGVA